MSYRVAFPDGLDVFRLLSDDGNQTLSPPQKELGIEGFSTLNPPLPPPEECLAIWRAMTTTRIMDDRMMKLQRQGRVAFVGTSTGQEAAIHGSGAVPGQDDWVFSALREGGVAIQRGMPIDEYISHMFGNANDTAKGRQMPNHFQCKDVNFPSWGSVLGTQLPHAVGAALAMKQRGEDNICLAYTGDGATSSCGFHSAVNFAAVTKAPVVFCIIDNGWAISVPSANQTKSRSYATKAKAYGLPGLDVDGNDPLACWSAVKMAADRARRGEGPSLIALRTYRMGGNSSSDDPSRYRQDAEVAHWAGRDPVSRFEQYIYAGDIAAKAELQCYRETREEEILQGVARAEKVGAPSLETLVTDVFADPPRHLRKQVVEALKLVAEKGEAEAIAGKFPL